MYVAVPPDATVEFPETEMEESDDAPDCVIVHVFETLLDVTVMRVRFFSVEG